MQYIRTVRGNIAAGPVAARHQKPDPVKLLILDDHRLFADGLEHLLRRLGDVVVEQSSSTTEALWLIEHGRRFDLVLLDLRLPGLDGFAFLRALRARRSSTPVVVISAEATPEHVERALSMGALGFIPKSLGGAELIEALRCVLAGDIFVPPDLWPDVASRRARRRDAVDGHAQIGPRQLEVLQLLAEGCSNKQIATVLGVSEATVKSHVTLLFRALDVNSRTACVLEAARRDLVKPLGR